MALIRGQSMATKVELRVSCKSLLDKDALSKSDPCALLFIQSEGSWIEIGRTEALKNNQNPTFSKPLEVDYFFEEVQKIRIRVYDLDNATASVSDDDFLGQVEASLGSIVSSSPFTRPLLKKSGDKAGKSTITITAEEKSSNNDSVLLTFRAQKLDKKDTFGKSDPFLEISRQGADGKWLVTHRSEVVNNNLSPNWRPMELSFIALCNGDVNKPIKIDCYDYDSASEPDLIGTFQTTLSEMLTAQGKEISWAAINPKKQKKKGYANSGMIYLSSCKIIKGYSFLDFIFGGLQLNFTVAIDFTGSNGHPRDPNSLHYIDVHRPNQYIQAIQAVGVVCQDYDSDKLFPALGFGAKIPPSTEASHEFAINFNGSNPFCAGVGGIIAAYKNCIPHVELWGPTNVSPVIHHVARFALASQNQEPQTGAANYYILLVLTDGVITDMNETREAIVYASHLPMSIIIVGVGDADFSDMQALDGDDGVLRSPRGEPVKRDIVQFVPFRDFKQASSARLASFVLAEIPKQVTGYFKMRGLQPRPPPQLAAQPPAQAGQPPAQADQQPGQLPAQPQ
ncbi:copine-3-like isoform X2 [Liolophura sinensis]|uniref:copine-3-like isoform X2 n=1 Tax=Liolophura sinensis TaxID=3198878 RepID=UPI00315943EE